MKKLYLVMIVILVIICFAGFISVSYATEEVKIGLIYPLTGKFGPSGNDLVKGIELATELINNKFEGINLPFTETEGLPNLGGAKIKLEQEDHEGSPEKALSGAERLISQNHVVALLGAYASSCTATASQAAERHQIPFLNAASTSPTLTEKGFKWFFRTTPNDVLFVGAFFEFLEDLKEKKGINIERIAILCEDSLPGSDAAKLAEENAEKYGYQVVSKIFFPTGTNDLSSELGKIKMAEPDVLFTLTYPSDQILLMKTAKQLNINIGGMLHSTGWVTNSMILPILKEDGDYILTRDVWSLDLAGRKPIIATINEMYKEKYGTDMNGNIARAFTAAYTLFIAINNAGSTENVAIQKALQNLNIPGDQIIMPWPGIQFDKTGQNFKGIPVIVQVKDMAYHTVWPFNIASMEVIWPMPKWSER